MVIIGLVEEDILAIDGRAVVSLEWVEVILARMVTRSERVSCG